MLASEVLASKGMKQQYHDFARYLHFEYVFKLLKSRESLT